MKYLEQLSRPSTALPQQMARLSELQTVRESLVVLQYQAGPGVKIL